MEAIFRVEDNRVLVSPNAAGPWDPRMQHGAAPSSLVVWAAERMVMPSEMRIARVTIELLREGRKIQLCAVRLKADGVLVVAATVLKVRAAAQPLPADIAEEKVTLP